MLKKQRGQPIYFWVTLMFYMIKAKRHFANADVLFLRFFVLLRVAIQCISWTLLELQRSAFCDILV